MNMKKSLASEISRLSQRGREDMRQNTLEAYTVIENILREINSKSKADAVRLSYEKLRLGYLQFALLGRTSSGKSTSVNAVSGQITVPENPMTSTPVPTYIAAGEPDTPVRVYRDEGGKLAVKELSTEDFLRQYCYNEQDQGNKNREKYQHDKYAVEEIPSAFLQKGIVLIDTLGVGATEADNRKTQEILNAGVHYVIFVTSQSNLGTEEVKFIQDVLGWSENGLDNPIDYHNFLIVANEKTDIVRAGFRESIQLLFKPEQCTVSKEEQKEFIEKNVYFVNARDARMVAVGTYPYVSLAPEGSTEAYLADARNLEKKERKYYAALEPEDDGNWSALMQRLGADAERLLNGEDSIVADIYDDLKATVEATKAALEQGIFFYKSEREDYTQMIAKLKEIQGNLKKEEEQVRKDLVSHGTKMLQCIQKCLDYFDSSKDGSGLASIFGPTIMSVLGSKYADLPKDLPDYKTFRKMTETQRMDVLTKVIQPILLDLLTQSAPEASDFLLKLEKDGPSAELKKLNNYLKAQKHSINGYVEEMEKANIQMIGIVLPTKNDIQQICDSLRGKVADALLDCFKAFGNTAQWQNILKKQLPTIKVGFFSRLFSSESATQNKFWEKITNTLVQITIQLLRDAMKSSNNNEFFTPLTGCYAESGNKFRDCYHDLYICCDSALRKLEGSMSLEENHRLIEQNKKFIQDCNNCLIKVVAAIKTGAIS